MHMTHTPMQVHRRNSCSLCVCAHVCVCVCVYVCVRARALCAAQVIVDFAQDGCVYLELRTTPKHRPRDGMTKASYTQAVLQGIQSAGERVNSMGR